MVCGAPLAGASGVPDALRRRAGKGEIMRNGPKPYAAMRLLRQKGKNEFDRHFTIDWNTAIAVVDPTRIGHSTPAEAGEVWALWHTEIGPGWRSYVDNRKPDFILMIAPDREPLMLSDLHAGDIRELSVNKQED